MLKQMCYLLCLLVCIAFYVPVIDAWEWEPLGLEQERIGTIAVDPINNDVIYVGTSFPNPNGIGGIYKSIDGGASWDMIFANSIYVSQFLIHPRNSDILYEAPGFDSMPDVIKSTNAGESWFWTGNGLHVIEANVQAIAMDPLHPDTLYAGTGGPHGGTLYKSVNGGEVWQYIGEEIIEMNIVKIAVDPINSQIIYVGGHGAGTLFKSTNGGANWRQLPISGGIGFISLVINPINSATLYAGYPLSDPQADLFKTIDGGETWETFSVGAGNRTTSIVLDPLNADKLYVATSGIVYCSSNAGLSWTALDNGLVDQWVETLATTDAGDWLYAGAEHGIYRLDLSTVGFESDDVTNQSYELLPNYPNPLTFQTTIGYSLHEAGPVSLKIFNTAGQLIRSLVSRDYLLAGEYAIA